MASKEEYKKEFDRFMNGLKKRNPGEREFVQAVQEVAQSIVPFVLDNPKYYDHRILDRMTEPDRVIIFRVCWEDDEGHTRTNRGYRVQFNNTIGPYKGGLRFHPSVNLSILKFLGFEQVFKNSLTTLPLGGAKGGSNFNPKGKSDGEIMRFCQAFMTELQRYIGPNIDVPAGDIGVGAREIGYMFGQYKRLVNSFNSGTLTGKGLNYGGSLIRTEATGYGTVYIMKEALERTGDSIKGKTCVISGSGNVAQYTAEKIIELGGKVLTMSDSAGSIYDSEGIDTEKLAFIKYLKNEKRGRIKEYADKFNVEYYEGSRPWSVPCDLAFPCATQNEINEEDAQTLVRRGCKGVSEGANMPSSIEAIDVFQESKIVYIPSKAANAGGVAISGLEMTQNSMRLQWSREEVDSRLKVIMKDIHDQCVSYGGSDKEGHIDYVKGANIAGFVKVADAMLAYGVI